MKLVFVYNAESGFLNTLLDIGHKIIRPETYSCNLCKLTYDSLGENQKWKAFRESTDIDMEFLHRDEFEKKYARKLDYPVVLRETGRLEIAISKKALESFTSLEELIRSLQELEQEYREEGRS